MRIQHNIMAMNSYRNLAGNNNALSKNLEKLSSGYRINRAGDDAAGLAISEKMRAQIAGLDQAQKNAQSGINLVKTAEGALTEVHDMLNRMVTLASQSANGTYTNTDREKLQAEIDALTAEIDRIADNSNFNGAKLLDGSLGAQASDSVIFAAGEGVNFGDGVTVESANGVGAASEFKLSLDKAMSDGDTVTMNFKVPTSGGGSVNKSITFQHTTDSSKNGTIAGTPAQDADSVTIFVSGNTLDKQMENIMKALTGGVGTAAAAAGVTDFTGEGTADKIGDIFGTDTSKIFKVTQEGNSVVFTANAEGANKKLHLSSVTSSNKDAGATIAPTVAGAVNTGGGVHTNGNGVTKLLTGAKHYQAGDKLKFEFNVGGTTTSATVEITNEMLASGDTAAITEAIVNKLKTTKFEDVASTKAFDESQFTVGDLFDVKANAKVADGSAEVGSVKMEIKDVTKELAVGDFAFQDVKVSKQGTAFASVASGDTVIVKNANTQATAGTAHKSTVTISENLADGDKFILEGTLADGRSFTVELTAGDSADASKNVFAIGADKDATALNIMNMLNGNAKVQLSDGTELKGSDIFGTAADAPFKAITNATNTLVFENTNTGLNNTAGVTGGISGVRIENAGDPGATGEQVVAGAEATKAQTSITFDKSKMEYGTAITIGEGENAKTFELVESADSEVTEEGNIKVVVADLAKKSSADIAAAFKTAIDAELKDTTTPANYSAWAGALGVGTAGSAHSNSLTGYVPGSDKITLTTATPGSTSEAVKTASTYGENKNVTINYNKDEEGNLKLKAGDTLKINGKTYQFDSDIRKVKNGNNFIKVDDFTDTKKIAEAIKLAVETDDSSLSVTVNDDNSVTISGKLVDGKYVDPKVEQTKVDGGLQLQIGADAVETIKVQVESMNAADLGIEGLNIGDVTNANKAIETIKSAIEQVSVTRGNLGAIQNRLEHTINNLGVMEENIQDAESNIRDTDIADEMMAYTKNNILIQSAQAMLAQANQVPQGVLQLMG